MENLVEELEKQQQSLLKKTWDFLKVRKLWWMTPLVILALLFLLSYLAGESISIANIYAPV